MQGVDGVFSVQSMEGGIEEEIRQGKSLADAAKAAGTAHFVYSSVGSAERNTVVAHFDSKFQSEEYNRAIGLPHTIMRPVFFFHNYDRMRPMVESGQFSFPLSADLKLQQISDDDYGSMVAQVFERPADFLGRAIEAASVDVTMTEVAATFSEVIGKPVAYQPISFDEFEQKAGHETALMFRWFQNIGYNADFAQLQRDFGAPSDLDSYLRARDWAAARVPTEAVA